MTLTTQRVGPETRPRYLHVLVLVAACLLAVVICAPPSAHAQSRGLAEVEPDWLALQPECAFGSDLRALGRMALLYPRPGLSAVVPAGGRLITRVRVPSGLTPPPGIQQDRALVGWSARLIGEGAPVGGSPRAATTDHAYPLRVADVRPDGAHTLVYRATIPIPAWAAPGTYGLIVSAPGGTDRVAAAVRIVPSGEAPRVGLLGALPDESLAEVRARLAALASAPADVFVARAEPTLLQALRMARLTRRDGPPEPLPAMILLPETDEGLPVALRYGDRLLTLGRCDGRYVRFEDQIAALARAEQREPRSLRPRDLPPRGALVREGGSGGARPLALPTTTFELEATAGATTVQAGADPRELTLLVPVGPRRIETTGLSEPPRFFPATIVGGTGQPPTVALRVRLAPNETVRVAVGERQPVVAQLEVAPQPLPAGSRARLSVRSEGPIALVAWQLAEDHTAVGTEATHAWGGPGDHPVRALVIGEAGAARALSLSVPVVTWQAEGCGCGAGSTGDAATSLWLLAWGLLQRSRRSRNSCMRPRR